MNILNNEHTRVNNYIVKTAKGCIVIDTGYPNKFNDFEKFFKKNGLSGEDIKFIFLTHVHSDHCGFLKEILKYTDAKVVLHQEAVERLKIGKNVNKGGWISTPSQVIMKTMEYFTNNNTFPIIEDNERLIVVEENSQIFKEEGFKLSIVELPGHTKDSIGLVIDDDGILFCGDAAMNILINTNKHPFRIEDKTDFQSSWEKMINLNLKYVYPSHGEPFDAEDLIKNKDYLVGKELYKGKI